LPKNHPTRTRPNAIFDVPARELAESEHPHWSQPRVPSRKVRRRLARRAGLFKPVRYSRGKGRGPRQPYYHPASKPAANDLPTGLISGFMNRLRKGNDR
jgi:hypothetical protein